MPVAHQLTWEHLRLLLPYGNYVAYAKKSLFPNNTLLNKIKKETPSSKSRGVLPYGSNIPRSKTTVK